MGALIGLSFRRLGSRPGKDVPIPPTPAERLQAYRAYKPVEFGNNHRWAWLYAQDAAADAEPVETQRGYLALSQGE